MVFKSSENQQRAESPDRIIVPGSGCAPPDELDMVAIDNLQRWMKERERDGTKSGRFTNAVLRLVGMGSVEFWPGRLGGKFAALVHTSQSEYFVQMGDDVIVPAISSLVLGESDNTQNAAPTPHSDITPDKH